VLKDQVYVLQQSKNTKHGAHTATQIQSRRHFPLSSMKIVRKLNNQFNAKAKAPGAAIAPGNDQTATHCSSYSHPRLGTILPILASIYVVHQMSYQEEYCQTCWLLEPALGSWFIQPCVGRPLRPILYRKPNK